ADEPLMIVGDLKDRRRYQLDSLLARAGERPELQALAAEIREAQAQVKLGEGFRWPTVAPAPGFNRAHGEQDAEAVGAARPPRCQRDMEIARGAVTTKIRTAYDVYATQVTAVE